MAATRRVVPLRSLTLPLPRSILRCVNARPCASVPGRLHSVTMGVNGLSAIFRQHARPQMVIRVESDAKQDGKGSQNILLVDAAAVLDHLLDLLPSSSRGWEAELDFYAELYRLACEFYQELQRNSGLRCVVVTGGAVPPGLEQHVIKCFQTRAKEGRSTPAEALVLMVLDQAHQDMGLQVERAVHRPDALLLAWYHRHSAQIFAVLTGNSDFFIYGVQKVVHVEDIVVDRGSVTFHVWSTDDCWQKWQQAAASKAGGRVPMVFMNRDLRRRAQVAAMLGTSTGSSIRQRLTALKDQQSGYFFPSPSKAAQLIMLHPTGRLDVEFFRSEPLRIHKFSEEDLAEFEAQLQAYVETDVAARSGKALEQLRLSAETLPGMEPSMVQRLERPVCPAMLLQFAARGLGILFAPEPHWSALQYVRRAAAVQLGAPGPVYEYCAASNRLHKLTAAPAEGQRSATWFDPAKQLPGVPEVDSTAGRPEPPSCNAGLPATLAQLRQAHGAAPEALLRFHAALLHAAATPVDDEDDDEYCAALRTQLVSALATPLELQQARDQARDAAAEPDGGRDQAPEARSAEVVPVGSMLGEKDWNEIDAKEVVAKARSSVGFMLMMKLHPYDPSACTPMAELPRQELFTLFFAAAQEDGRAGKVWAQLAQACFPKDWAAAKEGDKSAVRARHKELLAAAKSVNLTDSRLKGWMDRLKAFAESGGTAASSAGELLALRRDAAQMGPESTQWAAAKVCWAVAAPSVKLQALGDMWSWSSPTGAAMGGPPMRHPYQQELLDLVHQHLTSVQQAARQARPVLPLQIIFSTPTGSGKTFSAVMMHMHLLHPQRPSSTQSGHAVEGPGAQYGEGHRDTIVLYSVPTKQVLKKVGQDCEAHRLVYWTAAKDNDLYRVRRPYSIRSQKGGGSTASGSMKQQLEATEELGRKYNDIGNGQPTFILSDIYATAALLRTAAAASPDCWYHSSNLLLYFDEPTMGIHLDQGLQAVVRDIMRHAPLTTVLASATMPSWDKLPSWWKGDNRPAARTVISLEPYGLPMSRLRVLDMDPEQSTGTMTPISVLQLFRDAPSLQRQLAANPRLAVLLLRHLSAPQANQMLLETPKPAIDSSVVETDGWEAVDQDVRSLRQALTPKLQELEPERFEQLREQWVEPSRKIDKGWSEVVSQKGVTMVATLDPRRVALQIAGKWRDPEAWTAAAKELRAKVKAASTTQKALAKASQRTQKKTDDDVPPSMAQASSSGVTLRRGLEVTIDQAENADDDALVMLSKGVAYACHENNDPLVMLLYQQALLWVPERAFVQPAISVLVVDYSSIYGTDCSSVDTIVMCKDLGEHLSWEDHQQFIGRLRRDGIAIYPSWSLLCYATTGTRPSGDVLREQLQQQATKALLQLTAPAAEDGAAAPASSADAARRLQDSRQRLDPAGEFLTRADTAAAVLSATLRSLQGAGQPALAAPQLYKAAEARLQQWGAIKPALLLKLKAPAEQAALLDALQEVCFTTPPTPAYALIATKLLQWLNEEEIVSEEALAEWCKRQRPAAAPAAPSAFLEKVVKPFMAWLAEADEEEESEEEDDE